MDMDIDSREGGGNKKNIEDTLTLWEKMSVLWNKL